jgi:predicted MFS family arabinose efflux permease
LFGSIGVALLLIAHGLLIDQISWKGMVVVAALPGVVAGRLFFHYRNLIPSVSPEQGTNEAGREQRASRKHSVVLVVFFVSIVLRTLTTTAVMNFIPTYLTHSVGLSTTLGSYISVFLFIGAIAAAFIIGPAGDRYGPTRLLFMSSILIGVFLFGSTFVARAWALPAALLLLGAVVSASLPMQNMILSKLSPAGQEGTTFGSLMGFMTIANSIGPLIIGYCADRVGFAVTFRVATVPVLISSVLVLYVAGRMSPAENYVIRHK